MHFLSNKKQADDIIIIIFYLVRKDIEQFKCTGNLFEIGILRLRDFIEQSTTYH